ncbi:glycosyltransferase family 2 protein [Vibrio splendidus]
MGLVSIILPTYNGSKYISEAIDSVLKQSYIDWELIVVNDCSTDNVQEIVDEYIKLDSRIRLINNSDNLKLPKSLNKGFECSKGEFLTWLSDDNYLHPDFLITFLEEMHKSKCDFLYSDFNQIDHVGKFLRTVEVLPAERILESNVVAASFFYTRRLYKDVGNYDSSLFLLEDYDYWIRAARKFELRPIKKNLYSYRIHEGSLTSKKHTEIAKATILYMLETLSENKVYFSKTQVSAGLASTLYRAICIKSLPLTIKVAFWGAKATNGFLFYEFIKKAIRKKKVR